MEMFSDVYITYTNCRGETSRRHIRPLHWFIGSNEWHPKWLLEAEDLDKKEIRYFAMTGITKWEEIH